MAGLLSDAWDDPQNQGLLALGLGLLGSRGSFAQGLSQAGQQAMGVYGAGRQRQRANMREDERDTQAQAAFQMQQQMAQIQLQQAQAQQQRQQQLQALAQQSARSPQQTAMGDNGGPTLAAAQAVPTAQAGFDVPGYIKGLWGIDPDRAIALQKEMRKEAPELKEMQVMRDPASGQMVNVMVFKDGSTKVAPYGARPDIVMQNFGDRTEAVDKNATQAGNIWQMGASPDAKLQAGTTMRGQNMTDARSRDKNTIDQSAIGKVDWKQDTDGNWMALPKEVKTGDAVTPIATTAPGKRAVQAGHALDIIAEARGLIDKGTGSYAGAAIDQAARVVGASTKGGEVAAKLKALEGALMMAQPRMEGPQSNMDVLLYKQMAGQIGDSTLPAGNKKAAIDTIEKLHTKYKNGGQSSPGAPADVTGNFSDAEKESRYQSWKAKQK